MKLCPECGKHYEKGQFCPKDGAPLRDVPSGSATPAGAAMPPPGAGSTGEELVGQVIADRFRIVRSLGQGGMGHVYEAKHLYINKRVALKLLRPEITTSAEAVERFQREAMAASTIGHENIVRIDDFGRLPDGRVYLTMEYLDGESLSAQLARECPSLSRVLDLTIQVCRGLAAAHAKGIIHRDMKADNVFICAADDRVAILDFGIAKIGTQGSSNLTKTGAVFGTPNYMSPEQAMGQPVDCRTDIYSVGVMLYEMLTGVVPFEAESFMGVLTRHITEEPQPLHVRAPGRHIPPDLESVVLRAMAKKPAQRFEGAEELTAELVRLRAQEHGPETIPLRNGRSPGTQAAAAPISVAPAAVTATAGEMIERSVVPETPLPKRRWALGVVLAVALALGGWAVLAWKQSSQVISSASESLTRVIAAAKTSTGLGAGARETSSRVRGVQEGRWRERGERKTRAAETMAHESREPDAAPLLPVGALADVGPNASAVPDAAPAEPDSAPAEVRLIVASIPLGAAILRDGEQIGETPEVLMVPRGSEVRLKLRRRGYRDVLVEVRPDEDDKVTVRLRRKRSGRRVARRGSAGRRDADVGKRDPQPDRGGPAPSGQDDSHDHSDDADESAGSTTREDDHGS